jgi:3',5'-cyclic AMP phosphodiesterase CpdA
VRRLAHLSDLHFGREDPALAEALLADLSALRPDLTIVSGDLTQRARRRQFAAAADFLSRLDGPRLVVPGNHDIPLFDLVRRLADPLGRFRRHVALEVDPFFHDGELAVLGLNTARPSRWKDGRVSRAQVATIRARFGPLPARVFKVMVTHHPFVPTPHDPGAPRLERAAEALAAADGAGVELFLAGHLHEGYLADLREHHASLRRSILVAQAGTAISNRRRAEPNGYNVVTIAPPELGFDVRAWDGGAFRSTGVVTFARTPSGWERVGNGGSATSNKQ